MTPFSNPFKSLGVYKPHDHAQDDQEGKECPQICHLEEIGCFQECMWES